MNQDILACADRVVSELRALGDPERAAGETRYFKDTVNCLGTGLPKLQKLEKQLFHNAEKTWTVAEAMDLCDVLLSHKILEVTLFALTFLARFAEQMGEAEFLRCEGWLRENLCDSWAAVDHLGPHVLDTVVCNHPEFIERIMTWTHSDNRWLRRASAVTFILLARQGKFLDVAYNIASKLFADKSDDLVQKGNGWLLREAGMTDPDRLQQFLLAHGPDIPRTTLRYAIEKFPKEQRMELLAATKRVRL
ncbi:MAG: DNA alkylation repair protein [Armatimonadota bacterium]|nr:DNA alkylation repair protein [bacterium]